MTSLHYVLLYGAGCVALWAADLRAWRWAEGSGDRRSDRDARAGCTYELAILNGGPRLAIAAAIVMLLRRGCLVEGAAAARLVAAEPPGEAAHPLERTVFEAVRRHPQVAVTSLKRELARSEPIQRMVSELRRRGLLIEERTIAWVRLLWLAGPLLLAALGSARLATAWDYDDQWMRILLVAVLWTAAIAVFRVVQQAVSDGRPQPTARGRAALKLGETRDSTAGERDPHALLATAVALQGEAELWEIDPAVAAAIGAPREAAAMDGDPDWSCG